MRPKRRAPLRKSSRLQTFPTPPDKILLRLWNKNLLNLIHRNMQKLASEVLQECSY